MDLARRTLAICLTFIFSVVGFAYFTARLRDLMHPGVSSENPMTGAQTAMVVFLACSSSILLSAFFGTLIAGPRGYKVSAGWIIGICTFMDILVGANVIGIAVGGSNNGLHVGSTLMAAVAFIAVGALSYLAVRFVFERVYNRHAEP